MVKWLTDFWAKDHSKDIYQSWFGGALIAGFARESFFDTTPGPKFF